jgi:hypothetical protein
MQRGSSISTSIDTRRVLLLGFGVKLVVRRRLLMKRLPARPE